MSSSLIQTENDKETGGAELTSISLSRHKRLKWLFSNLLKIHATGVKLSYAEGSQHLIVCQHI